MLLTGDDLRELTNRTHFSSQIKVLRGMGIEHRSRPDGSIAVLRSHVEQVLGGVSQGKRKPKDAEPNWGAMHATRA